MVRNIWLGRGALWLVPLTFVAVLFYLPVLNLLGLGFSADFLDTLRDSNTVEAIWFTLWQATLSTLISLVLAIPAAQLLYQREFRGRRLWQSFVTVPMVLPSIAVAVMFASHREFHRIYVDLGLGWFYENPHYWIIVAHVFFNFSIAVRAIGSAWSALDSGPEQAAELDGAGRFRVLLQISLPQLRSSIFSAAALIFLYCTTSFGIILVLGDGLVRSIETEISIAATQFLDLEKAAGLAILQTLISLLAYVISSKFANQGLRLDAAENDENLPAITKRDWAAVAISATVIIGWIAIPILGLASRAFVSDGKLSLVNFANLLGRGERDLLNISVVEAAANSLRNLVVSSILALGVGFVAAYLLSRRSRTSSGLLINRALDFLLLLPVGVSAVVLGLGYLIAFSTPPFELRSSWLVLPLVQSLMAVPLIIRIVYPALISIEAEQLESAQLAGASSWQSFVLVEAGIIRQSIITAVAFTMIVSLGEFGAATLLTYGDQATLPTVLYQLISRPGGQNFGMAMAAATLILVLSFVVIALANQKRFSPRSNA